MNFLDRTLEQLDECEHEREKLRHAITMLEEALERGPISRDRLEEIVREARS